ncbi:MAG: hypothetical protein V1494_00595 [Candidatus Diapherotrites archaeon]
MGAFEERLKDRTKKMVVSVEGGDYETLYSKIGELEKFGFQLFKVRESKGEFFSSLNALMIRKMDEADDDSCHFCGKVNVSEDGALLTPNFAGGKKTRICTHCLQILRFLTANFVKEEKKNKEVKK